MLEGSRWWRDTELDGLEVLQATFVRHAYARHTHEHYALCLYDAGRADFECRGATHHLYAGSLAAINPDEVHDGRAGDAMGWTYRVIYPQPALLERVSSALHGKASGLPFFPTAIHDPQISDAFHRLHAALAEPSAPLERESLLWHALGVLVRNHADLRPPVAPNPPREPGAVQAVKQRLEDDPATQVSLEDLAGSVGLSVFQLVRAFRQATGLPPHAYQTLLRVNLARRLLRTGSSLADVALDSGFSDQNHLARHFKRVHGVTPGQYARTFTSPTR